MLYKKKRTSLLILAVLALLALTPMASCASGSDHATCIAIAYTGENYQGVAWEIYQIGEYDLWWKIQREDPNPRMIFDLPNDSISSLRVRPGYRVTLYEHAELLGKSLVLEKDTPSLGDAWNLQASSLGVFETETEEIAEVLANCREEFAFLMNTGEPQWYGDTTDDERIEAGGFILRLFDDLGYDVSRWTPASFAQMMNNFYDWRKDLSIWHTACLVLDVNPLPYEEIFAEIEE